jgi:hypothetical protein
MNRSSADAECPGRFENARAGRELPADAFDNIRAYRVTPESLALASCSRETRLDPFDNHCSLKLGEDAHHLKHGLPGWRAGVDTLLM